MFRPGQSVRVTCDRYGRPTSSVLNAEQTHVGEILGCVAGTYSIRIDYPNGDWIVTTAEESTLSNNHY